MLIKIKSREELSKIHSVDVSGFYSADPELHYNIVGPMLTLLNKIVVAEKDVRGYLVEIGRHRWGFNFCDAEVIDSRLAKILYDAP